MLHVARNRVRVVAVVLLADARSARAGGRVKRNLTQPRWVPPTTVAQACDGSLLVVDERFGEPAPDRLDYFMYRIPAGTGRGGARG